MVSVGVVDVVLVVLQCVVVVVALLGSEAVRLARALYLPAVSVGLADLRQVRLVSLDMPAIVSPLMVRKLPVGFFFL